MGIRWALDGRNQEVDAGMTATSLLIPNAVRECVRIVHSPKRVPVDLAKKRKREKENI